MTTPKSAAAKLPQDWEPYPELEPEPKDMEQLPPIIDIISKLRQALTPGDDYPYHPTILIGGEIPIYSDIPDPDTGRDDPRIPDCLIAFDVDTAEINRIRGYHPEHAGKPPDLVIEVASASTHDEDSVAKRTFYQQVQIPEYWRLDPTGGDYHGQPIIGERLTEGAYEPLPLLHHQDGSLGCTSLLLNLEFRWHDGRFSIHDPQTGAEHEHPSARAERLADRERLLSEENARLREELRRLSGNQPEA